MNSVDFCYWLQGYFELAPPSGLSPIQTSIIKNHLSIVFKHEIDPSYGGNQQELQDIHNGPILSPNYPDSFVPTTTLRC